MTESAGPAYAIMTDANQDFTLDEAIRRATRFAELDLAWIEEPLPADDFDGHVRLSAHSGDLERSIRSIMNTDSGDHEHPLALA